MTFASLPLHTEELVINWHLSEACNYSCRYCYSKWQHKPAAAELFRDPEATYALLDELAGFFAPDNRNNPLRDRMRWNALRLNLAGGEPLLYPQRISATIALARERGFSLSIITNASRLSPELIEDIAPNLSTLGISVDSVDDICNRAIGRADRHGQVVDQSDLEILIGKVREHNPNLRLKINTVVNALNHREDLTPLIRELSPQRWKVLRMLPVLTDDLAVSDAEFGAFLERHRSLGDILRAEDNEDLTASYIMVDPHGRFFQNDKISAAGEYCYSTPILDSGARTAFADVGFSCDKFTARY